MNETAPNGNTATQEVQANDYLLAMVAKWGRQDAGPFVIFPILLVAMVAIIFFVTRGKKWGDYAYDGKWAARLSLFALMLVTLLASVGTSAFVFPQIKGKISMEFPSQTIDAIKIGIYGLEFRRQISSWVPADQKDFYNCVVAVGFADHGQRPACTTPECVKPYPASSKEQILSAIRDVQTGKIAATDQLQVCKRFALP